MKRFRNISLFIFIFSSAVSQAQQSVTVDTLAGQLSSNTAMINTMKKIKISGYIQPQFQIADTQGVKTFAGGNFNSGVDNRFKVRRAEFKTMYDNGKTQIVANIDITQSGVVIKDAYGKFTEQWLQMFSVTAGIFSCPFGWEVPSSASVIGSPEKSRANQTLFSSDRDLGAKLTFQMPGTSPLNPLKIEGGIFNGTGNRADDFDSYKDFIGNIHWNAATKNKKTSYAFGVSFYDGGWRKGNDTAYHTGVMTNGSTGFIETIVTGSNNTATTRRYYGADAQLSIEEPLGTTTFRVEYVTGKQPGTGKQPAGISVTPTSVSAYAAPTVTLINGSTIPALVYNRSVEGFYAEVIQDIGKTHTQLMLKYDWWDPNTKVAGKQLTDANGFSQADIKYTDWGIGLIYNWDANVKMMAWYDIVTNETTGLKGYERDLPDNIWTFRIQYKF